MEISKDGARITFKTCEPFYTREKLGMKPNTVRRVSRDDARILLISSLYLLLEIEVKNAGAENESFVRNLTDISYFDDRFIFSWHHPGDIGSEP